MTLPLPERIRVSDKSRAAIETIADEGDSFRFDCFDEDVGAAAGCFDGAVAGRDAAAEEIVAAAGLSSISLVHLRLL